MIIDEEVEIAINNANISNLEEKGYIIPKFYNKNKRKLVVKRGSKIKVKVSDLTKSSHVLINVKCDYCFEDKLIPYKEYIRSVSINEFVKKYCCENCDHLKKREIYGYRQNQGLLQRGDKGYWLFKENRLRELDEYIKKHGTITAIQKDKIGACILYAIKDHEENINDCCLELGYSLCDVIKNYKPEGYYDDFNNLTNDIYKIIEELGRFPKQKEVLNYLHIGNNILLGFGGIKEIKDKMGYCDENDLIDDRGFKNRSTYEFMTAQYLIGNNISYKREQNPFNKRYKNLRSDFTFYLDNKEIHVEIWGYSQTDKSSERSINYNKKRIMKEKLYSKSKHDLISINYEIFQGKYKDIQNRLYEIFNPYLKLKFKNVKQEKFIPANKLSDKELLDEIMKFSSDNHTFPMQSTLQENGLYYLYEEILNRGHDYYGFAKKFGKTTHRKLNAWNKETIFNTFDYMISNYGHILRTEEIKKNRDEIIKGIVEGSKKIFGTITEARICYYEYIASNGIKLSESDLEYIDNAINIRKGFNRTYMTEERINRLKIVLDLQIINNSI